MTECERLIKEGKFSEDFLKEEVRDGFLVDRERKKLWMLSLDLLFQFEKVCKKYGFQYFLCGGSMLGAVRHKGFIPWDDDLDVFLFRDDYEKFLKLGHEFDDPYFLQTPDTDPGYFYTMAKIRNSRTTMLVDEFKYQKFNQGIWLSIFPLDHWKVEGGEAIRDRINELILDNSTYMRISNPELDEKNRKRVANYSGRDPMEVNREIHALGSQYNDEDTEYISLTTNTRYPLRCLVYPKTVFESAVMADFEDYKLPIPVGYDTYLKIAYGDYMKFPPMEKRLAWHNFKIDTDHPYTQYLRTV